jgi:LysM repeat protein
MKKIFFLLFLLPVAALAQKEYKTHTVGPKESLSSIGRLYNINGRELADYNKIDYDKGLSIGQVLKIPVKNTETVTDAQAPVKTVEAPKPQSIAAKKGLPVYHTVEKKQTLYAISKLYNVTVADIKQWNKLTADGLNEGSKIIVGYGGGEAKTTVPVTVAAEQPKVIKEETPKTVKAEEPKVITEPVKEIKKETPPPAVVKPVAQAGNSYFKNDFESQATGRRLITENGTGGVFKSNSGWEDGKYYCLHNIAVPGTIIKITNNSNGKSVYAKVLDVIPDIKQNSGLVIRLSNAGADALGITNDKMDCTLNYSR